MVLISLESNKICGPILTCDHATMDHQHQWVFTNIGNISGLCYQGYKPGVKGPWNGFTLLTFVIPFVKLIQDMMHAEYNHNNVKTIFQV